MLIYVTYDPLLENIEEVFDSEQKAKEYCEKRNYEENRINSNYAYWFTWEERELR